MTFVLGALNLSHPASPAAPAAGSITAGAVVLVLVALLAVAATYRRAIRRRPGQPTSRHPRRGTSALVLCAISAVLFALTSVAQRPLASLTIVSRHSAQRTMTVVSPPRRHARLAGTRPLTAPARRGARSAPVSA